MATKRKTPSTRRSSASKRGPGTREVLKAPSGVFFARRTAAGRFKEMDERGRALAGDRRRKATTKAKRGQVDRGDRAAA
jgi:hypothetical protein